MTNAELVNRDPVGLTQREMLLRLDARLDMYETRVRVLEDESLMSKTERKTIMAMFGSLRSTVLTAAAVGPILAGIIVLLVK